MRTPLLVLALLLPALVPCRGNDAPPEEQAPAPPPLPPLPSPRPSPAGEERVTPSPGTARMLAGLGWLARDSGDLVRRPDDPSAPMAALGRAGRLVTRMLLSRASLVWHEGAIVYEESGEPVGAGPLRGMLEGLATFEAAGAADPREAGKALAAWGIPPAFHGRKILNPDGTPTYFGSMLHQFYSRRPDALKLLTAQRLAQSLDIFEQAYAQAFRQQAPDAARKDIERAWAMLSARLREGAQPMALKPYADLGAALKEHRRSFEKEAASAVEAGPGGARRAKEAEAALAALDALAKQRYHRHMSITDLPAPKKEPLDPRPSLSSSLPAVLGVLERVNGRPLTPEQEESLIKSFPMGELVWQLRAQELWREGLRGQGVKVAVIDTGVARNPEIDGAVKARHNMTAQRGDALLGEHATHVAGIIHQLAPEAEIRSYNVGSDSERANPRLEGDFKEAVMAGVEKAVADGNHVINLSLYVTGGLDGEMSRLIDRHAARGVIFVISAGNNGAGSGVGYPSVAEGALTSGALNAAGRAAGFSSDGANPDPRTLGMVVKDIFLTPGEKVYSTLPTPPGRQAEHGAMDGTSMSAPGLAGVSALLLQSVRAFTPVPDPVSASRRVKEALYGSASELPEPLRDPDTPDDQHLLVVDPQAALQRLRGSIAGR